MCIRDRYQRRVRGVRKMLCSRLVILCVLLVTLTSLNGIYGADVVTLTTRNIEEKTSSGVWMVEFYAPWCGHCKRLAPIWEELAAAADGLFNVGKVDCTVETSLKDKYGVNGFPSIKMIKDGKVIPYKSGARTVEAFLKFVKENGGGSGSAAPAAKKQDPPRILQNPNKNPKKGLKNKPPPSRVGRK
eukprot:TRINITY_DN276_c0_g2_i1.p1 TRINITY_DN276_c0_g2~~TRINITY_DN276_c0_g2_i1.p1  ORF type:complete len:187 (-),score=37.77 TRINITY_DN276_c0_g2_i1:64-624(-)